MYRAHGVARIPRTRDQSLSPRPPTFTERGLSTRTRLNIWRFLELGWHPLAILDREGCSERAVYNIQSNIRAHRSLRVPLKGKLGAPNEIVHRLALERGVHVHRATVSRFLHKMSWSRRTLRPISIDRGEELRESYRRDETIRAGGSGGWRHRAYAPVGHEARYMADIKRSSTWAILHAYTINGYLPCMGIKEGYFSREQFIDWIENSLLPTLNRIYGNRPMVIVLDNVAIHTNEVIEAAGDIVRYLPPYLLDYNLIELTFSVLKAWIRRTVDFGGFLRAAIQESKCDRFARRHFKYAAGGLYIE
ncbi:uncharacterized protein BDR25DRAFT_338227 [Lindgomyces ingoldianus]|uniref:Uncharacterized protein n=1 Tax=Lindgomyces ingoldianus TaxID=673940 RepID=A0ACB6Q8R9_9PLEO|nr:uncharacterized protein BDR25DRAFT_338227 [Lindgomyces ingoldianus]KAF2462532.1 hypothetical protein BDR25DRAFT_338227 [Lindgomyces ingoldianus]